jgi:hypothetical protein
MKRNLVDYADIHLPDCMIEKIAAEPSRYEVRALRGCIEVAELPRAKGAIGDFYHCGTKITRGPKRGRIITDSEGVQHRFKNLSEVFRYIASQASK